MKNKIRTPLGLFDYSQYAAFVVLNCIPFFGFVVFNWSGRELFLFYAFELAVSTVFMIPRIIIYAMKTGDEEGKSVFGIILTVFFIMIYHIAFFLLTGTFIIHAAFAPGAAEGAIIAIEDITGFLWINFTAVVLITGEYTAGLILSFAKTRENKFLESDDYALEIYVFPILFLTAFGLVYGASVFLRLTATWHHLVILVLVIVAKSAAQIALENRKKRSVLENMISSPGKENEEFNLNKNDMV
ncbi:MAG: hypothetical protein JW904_00590 [Spirochaetales bacterium]|nr:hypothetical protein [Spirochaetales bacterium]